MLASNFTRALLLYEVRPRGPGSLFTGIFIYIGTCLLVYAYWNFFTAQMILGQHGGQYRPKVIMYRNSII